MKKLFTILLIMSMVLCVSVSLCYAVDNHGADAQSESMSVESGEDPIPDENVTKEAGGGEVIDAEPEEVPDVPEEVVSEEEIEEELDLEKTDFLYGNMKYYVIGGAVLLVLIIVLIIAAGSRKKKNAYHSRH